MAGVAIVSDLLKKNPNLGSPQFSTSSTISASVAAAACIAFASRFFYTAGEWKQLVITSLRSFILYYLPLLEPRVISDEEEDDFLQETQEEQKVDLVVPFKRSLKQIVRETTVVTTRRVLEKLAVHYVSQRIAWKLLKDIPRSTTRKAGRGLPTMVYIFKDTFLGDAASWIVQVGIEIYRFFSGISKSDKESTTVNKSQEVRILEKKVAGVTIRCSASLVFASIGAGIGATLIRPSTGQWIEFSAGCAAGDLAGPVIVSIYLDKAFHGEV